MLLILLKSAACLAIFMAFYKLCLERENMHQFKRFYLLSALVVSFIIPFITFIKYVEPTFEVPYFNADHSVPLDLLPVDEPILEEPTDYLPMILWSIYGLGVLLFGIKFGLNLFKMISKINTNEKQKQGHFITVLLQDLISPHTFFSYIFLNKKKFETKEIPHEVLLHEAAHAKQKHSLDVLFIELLQVVFWFNPLLYFIKKDIKLNHEFLADEAVLKHGIDSSTYQNTLLAFSNTAAEPELANAINYSLIKKRFTIMKTKTSKKAIWLRSLLLLPLLGVLLFSFSSIKEVEKDIMPAMIFPNEQQENNSLDAFDTLLENNQIMYTIDKDEYYKNVTFKFRDKNKNIITTKSYGELTEAQKKRLPPPPSKPMQKSPSQEKLNSWLDSSKYGIWVDGKRIQNTLLNTFLPTSFVHYFQSKLEKNAKNYDKHFYQVNLYTQKAFDKAYPNKLEPLTTGTEIFIYENENSLQALKTNTSKTNFEVNTIYEQESLLTVNGIVCDGCELNLSKKGVENLILSTTTGENIKSFNIKFPKKPTTNIKGNSLNKQAISYLNSVAIGTKIQLFNIKTNNKTKLSPVIITIVDKNAKNYSHSPTVKKGEQSPLPPPPPPPAPIDEYNRMKKRAEENLPPPPPPPVSDKKLIENMASKNATFYYNGDEISSDKALNLVKDNSKLNIASHTNNGVSTVHLSTKPISIINGKASISENRKKIYEERRKMIESKKEMRDEMLAERKLMLKESKKEHKKMRDKMLAERDEMMKKRDEMYKKRRPLHEQFKGMEANGGEFFFESDKITEAKAIELIKENPKLNVSMQNNNGESTVHLSKKGIKVVNGKLVKREN